MTKFFFLLAAESNGHEVALTSHLEEYQPEEVSLPPEIRAHLEKLLQCHLNNLNSEGCFTIPGTSYHPLPTSETFDILHIQTYGLLNDGLVCALISIVLSFHRLGLKDHIADTIPPALDLPAMVLKKILKALPSQDAFSLQSFVTSWNTSDKYPKIYPNSEATSLADAILSNLPLKYGPTNLPFLTQFYGAFHCSECGQDYDSVPNWEGQVGSIIPVLSVPESEDYVDLLDLVENFLTEPFETRCTNQDCRSRIADGRIVPIKGMFTILSLDRIDMDNPNRKKMTRIRLTAAEHQGLISVISHIGDVNSGHYVSYHEAEGRWYLNDDSEHFQSAENPLGENVEYLGPDETPELLFFRNPA